MLQYTADGCGFKVCRAAIFECAVCGHEVLQCNVGGNIEEPAKCPNTTCGKTWTMILMHNSSEYNDKQLIKMQVGNMSGAA